MEKWNECARVYTAIDVDLAWRRWRRKKLEKGWNASRYESETSTLKRFCFPTKVILNRRQAEENNNRDDFDCTSKTANAILFCSLISIAVMDTSKFHRRRCPHRHHRRRLRSRRRCKIFPWKYTNYWIQQWNHWSSCMLFTTADSRLIQFFFYFNFSSFVFVHVMHFSVVWNVCLIVWFSIKINFISNEKWTVKIWVNSTLFRQKHQMKQ